MVRWFDMGTLKLQVHIDSKFYHTAKVFMHTGLGLFGVCRNYARAPVCSGTECSDKGPHGDITPEKLRHSFKAARRALKRYSSGEGGSLSDVAAEEEERELSAEAAQLPSISLEPSIFNATHVELLSRLIDRYESGLAGFEEKGGEDFEPCGRSLKDTKEDILKLIEMTAAKQIEAQTDAIENQLLPALAAEGLSVQEDAVVVVPSIATTRTLNFEYAVWLKLMGEKAAGVRLFSSEGTASDEEAVMNMETRRIDSELGSAAFGDPWRMHYDLFGLQAERHVGHFFRGY
uniref:Uncharacterized protein n=1 Tax=Chromera velia CCMP2878 TaxID=1169474 RepID=A0A0G4FCX8_9ALVE|eukprot:Cvel_16389.t1-p1 / transcript=Cvel_16389.t1 / gene=Cvel_16389 / organism=Chromera_velia_CCMP2878 / gene_product=hypothetical protein / transcript_product=hypothetical protein / location=Cvel_scaffold1261:6615-8880(-) / protein_length=288 / sequence_SO=supercontig / SO=protein_coding / is_pseudo=false